MTNQKKTVLITGASGGIGKALSDLFAANGYHLVLVARNEAKLIELSKFYQEQYQTECLILAKDLSRAEAPGEILETIQDKGLGIDILVNNAGFGINKPFAEIPFQEVLEMMYLNVAALTQMTRLFLPAMMKEGQGRILNVGSVASFCPAPFWAVYNATKAYVLSFSEALAEELEGSGVTVTALCPGVTLTDFQCRAQMEKTSLLVKLNPMTAEQVAKIGYHALMKGRRVVVTGWINKLITFSVRFLPRFLVPKTAKLMI